MTVSAGGENGTKGGTMGYTEILPGIALEQTHCAALACDSAVSVLCCFTSTETLRLIRDGEPRTATSTFTQLQSSANLIVYWLVECCFTSTETVGLLGIIFNTSTMTVMSTRSRLKEEAVSDKEEDKQLILIQLYI